jgi:hypothetical protein
MVFKFFKKAKERLRLIWCAVIGKKIIPSYFDNDGINTGDLTEKYP